MQTDSKSTADSPQVNEAPEHVHGEEVKRELKREISSSTACTDIDPPSSPSSTIDDDASAYSATNHSDSNGSEIDDNDATNDIKDGIGDEVNSLKDGNGVLVGWGQADNLGGFNLIWSENREEKDLPHILQRRP